MKTHQFINYQEEFEKKIEEEKEELWKRQTQLEQQYREEVEN